MEQMRADMKLKRAQAAGELWKTGIAVVAGLATVVTALGDFVGSHRA